MKLSEFIAARSANATGTYTGREMILAVDCSADGSAAVADYDIAGIHIEDVGAEIETESETRTYIAEGQETIRTTARRKFTIDGVRYISDTFQDFLCSHAVKYGTGAGVSRGYVYFHAGTLAGEKGTLTISVQSDGGGDAASLAELKAELTSVGTPEEYSYA